MNGEEFLVSVLEETRTKRELGIGLAYKTALEALGVLKNLGWEVISPLGKAQGDGSLVSRVRYFWRDDVAGDDYEVKADFRFGKRTAQPIEREPKLVTDGKFIVDSLQKVGLIVIPVSWKTTGDCIDVLIPVQAETGDQVAYITLY